MHVIETRYIHVGHAKNSDWCAHMKKIEVPSEWNGISEVTCTVIETRYVGHAKTHEKKLSDY